MTKISLLPTDSAPTLTDLIPTVDVETSTTKKVTVAALKTSMGGDITLYTGFDFVANGCVWSGDSYAVNRNASMTAGVIVIGGYPLTASAVTARSFTASKDTYIDASSNGSGGITLTYTEVANNAASPSLAANSVRIGIIVTGATTIAAVGSINMGEENKVLPIASSIPYAVTDSLGNLICPRDPNRRILGYRQVLTNLTTTNGTATDMTGLNLTCIVPTGRKVRVSGYIGSSTLSVANNAVVMYLYDATAAAQLAQDVGSTNASGDAASAHPMTVVTPSVATKNYKAQFSRGSNAATVNSQGAANNPNYILVELV